MKINIFEGARRLTQILMGLVVLGAAIIIWNHSPYMEDYYQIDAPDKAPYKVEKCDKNAEHISVDTNESLSKDDHVTLCFKKMLASDGMWLLPYKLEGDIYRLNNSFSEDVSSYIELKSRDFVLSESDRKSFKTRWWVQRAKEIAEIVGYLFVALLCIHFLSMLIGWTTRGFLGIQNGKDHRDTM